MPNDYGLFKLSGGGSTGAHRFAYEDMVEEIAAGLELDHLCRVRRCVNPSHLEPVDRRENLLRGDTFAAAHHAKTHCKRGHEFTPENTIVKIRNGNENRECRTCATAAAKVRNDAVPRHPRPAEWRSTLAKRNAAKTHCPQGHEYTPENTYLEYGKYRRCKTCKLGRQKRKTA